MRQIGILKGFKDNISDNQIIRFTIEFVFNHKKTRKMKKLIILLFVFISNSILGQLLSPCDHAEHFYINSKTRFETINYRLENRSLIWNSIKIILDFEVGTKCIGIERYKKLENPLVLNAEDPNISKYIEFLDRLIKDADFIENYASKDLYFKQTLLYYKARLNQAIQNYSQAKADYQSILQSEIPDNHAGDEIRARVFYRMAQINFAEGNYEKAIEYCYDIRNLKTKPHFDQAIDSDMEAGIYSHTYNDEKIRIPQDRLILYILKHQNKTMEVIGFLKLRAKEQLLSQSKELIKERRSWYPLSRVYRVIPKDYRYSTIYRRIRTENVYLNELLNYLKTENKIREMKKLKRRIRNVRNERRLNKLISEL